MAEGVFSFCQALTHQNETNEQARGWQTIVMEECVLILSEVEEDIWIFVRLEHDPENHFGRIPSPDADNGYLDNNFSENLCHSFMENLYASIRMWHGPIRGWVFRERVGEL
jgi:hypothetical protein